MFKPWVPRLILSPGIQAELNRIAGPFVGKTRTTKRLCARVAALIADRHPGHAIVVIDATRHEDRVTGTLNLLVTVDGEPDQGLVFATRSRDRADARAEATGRPWQPSALPEWGRR